MKHAKRPTRKQKVLIQAARLNYENWLVVKDTAVEMVIRNQADGQDTDYTKGAL